MKQRFDQVISELEEERQRVDEDLRRFVVVAAYRRAMMLSRRHVLQRRRCTPLLARYLPNT